MQIAISSMSLRRAMNGKLNLVEFINLAKERYDVDNVEISSTHIKSLLPADLEAIKKALAAKKVNLVNIPCEAASMYHPDPKESDPNINMVRRWMRVTHQLGGKALRVHSGAKIVEEKLADEARIHAALGSDGGDEDMSEEKTIAGIINGYKRVSFTAQSLKLMLLMENHSGSYGQPGVLSRICDGVGNPAVFKLCLDMKGFAPEKLNDGLKLLVPHTHIIRVGSNGAAPGGQGAALDIGRCIQAAKEALFDGIISVEFGGGGDELAGLEKDIALLKSVA